MELSILYTVLVFLAIFFISLNILWQKPKVNQPPGRTGWPVVGETLDYVLNIRRGYPHKFVNDRMIQHSPECFKTSILGQPFAFLCGPAGNKFMFFSQRNLVIRPWWPVTLTKIFPVGFDKNAKIDVPLTIKKVVSQFFKPEAFQRYIRIMDAITQRYFAYEWEGKNEVYVFPLVRKYTFWLASRFFISVEEVDHVERLADTFHVLASGIISIPIAFPGTPFNKGIKAAKVLGEELKTIVKQKKQDLGMQKSAPDQDLLSVLLRMVDENGDPLLSDQIIVEGIMGLLVAGADGTSSTITMVTKYLAELPHIYNEVFREQMEIAKSKAPGELLNWEDIQKMKYSWNVACEVMRLSPPSPGVFREAMEDINFAGYTIPKGWKLHWSPFSTHKNPKYFPNPEKFDPNRYDGNGPPPYTFVPFGGGLWMCPGKEFARLQILVFMHNLVKRFKWEKLLPNEKMIVRLSPTPEKGLPIRLIPHEMGNKQD